MRSRGKEVRVGFNNSGMERDNWMGEVQKGEVSEVREWKRKRRGSVERKSRGIQRK